MVINGKFIIVWYDTHIERYEETKELDYTKNVFKINGHNLCINFNG